MIARETVEPGTLALRKIVSVFGQEVLQPDGQLDRGKLGMIVFPSKEKRQKLDQLLDPFIRKAIKDQIASLSSNHPLVIVDIPLLYEGSQLPIEEKKQRADILFDNNGTKEKLVGQIENWLFANRFL